MYRCIENRQYYFGEKTALFKTNQLFAIKNRKI